jgi:hypothetical protein
MQVVLLDEADPTPCILEPKHITLHPFRPDLCIAIDSNPEDKNELEIPED